MIASGISQIGGKFRLRKTLQEFTPNHEFFLSEFFGAGWYELNKPRCRYECFNDKNSEYMNYFVVIKNHPEEFDKLKEGPLGLVSQKLANEIYSGNLKPKNDIERAYFFYYLNKVSFGSQPSKGYGGILQEITDSVLNYRGISLQGFDRQVKKAKANYRGITPKNLNYKGLSPKTTRPYTNNDMGLLTPIDPKAIERLRYVNLTCYDFRKVYKLFYNAFYKRKGLTKECFIYEDPPYPDGNEENYYHGLFTLENHQELIDLNLDSPFNIMLSIGGDCELYLDSFGDAGWIIEEVFTKYSTNANTQEEVKEYVIMNYDIKKESKMIMDNQVSLTKFMED